MFLCAGRVGSTRNITFYLIQIKGLTCFYEIVLFIRPGPLFGGFFELFPAWKAVYVPFSPRSGVLYSGAASKSRLGRGYKAAHYAFVLASVRSATPEPREIACIDYPQRHFAPAALPHRCSSGSRMRVPHRGRPAIFFVFPWAGPGMGGRICKLAIEAHEGSIVRKSPWPGYEDGVCTSAISPRFPDLSTS